MNRGLNLALLLIAVMSPACKSQVAEKTLAESFASIGDADAAMAVGDFARADAALTEVLRKSAVNADVLGEVYSKQALCKLKLQKVEEAVQSLEQADRAGASGPEFHVAAMELAIQKGDKAKAKQHWSQLRRIDKNAKAPPGL